MPKRVSFYVFLSAIIIAVFVLGFNLGKASSRKQPGPATILEPEITALDISKEEATKPHEVRPIADQGIPVKAEVKPAEKEKILKSEFQKGMTYVAWTANGYSNAKSAASMEQLVSIGTEWVSLVTTRYQDHYNSTDIYALQDKTPTDESLIFAIRKLHDLKLKVMLKPHVDIVEGNGKWRGEISFDNAGDWQTWFDNYSAYILHYADMAEKEDVEIFCIGTELTQSVLTQAQQWKDLIKKVRQAYSGQLTYAANWSNEFEQITFWDSLDYAGIDPYFPLVVSSNPTVEELKSAWLDWIKQIEAWQAKINKPVVFTEIGYKSSRDATDEPWQHNAIGELDLELQVNCYRALLESLWDKPWFYGVYWWYWGVNPKMGGELNRDFIPQNKPASDVVKEWYSKAVVGK